MHDPELVVFDEAITSLDMSLQSQIVDLIADIQTELGSAYLFITHDLARAMEVSDRIAIMYLGKIVELIPAARFLGPLHPYAKALIASTPYVDTADSRPDAPPIVGDVPSAMNPPSGCRFQTRCPYARDICRATEPELVEHDASHWVACHFATELAAAEQASDARAVVAP